MKEKGFSIKDNSGRYHIRGGELWQAPSRAKEACGPARIRDKVLEIMLYPNDGYEDVLNEIQSAIKAESASQQFRLLLNRIISPLILLAPAFIIIAFIAILGAYGNLVNELINKNNVDTLFGITQWELFFIETTAFIVGAYAFPLVFQGDYGGTIQTFKDLVDSDKVLKRKVIALLSILNKGKHVETVLIWNPNLLSPSHEWVRDSLIPGAVESGMKLTLHVRMDEKFAAQRIVSTLDKDEQTWIEQGLPDTPNPEQRHIPLEYLEDWERDILPVLAAASTAFLPPDWKREEDETGDASSLSNVVSLPLATLVMDQFGSRLYSGNYSREDVSIGLFFSRCFNDYDLLFPVEAQTEDMWIASPELLETQLVKIREEQKFIPAFYHSNAASLMEKVNDAAAALILMGTHQDSSLFNDNKLHALEGFVRIIARTVQFKVLRRYWDLLVTLELPDRIENLEDELYRLMDTDTLETLVWAFRRAGMYDKTSLCYKFLSAINPLSSGIGVGVVLGEQGNYKDAVNQLLKVEVEWMGGELASTHIPDLRPAESRVSPAKRISLYVYLTVIIVMNRLEEYKELAENAFRIMDRLLREMRDGERNNEDLTRYYNVLASYYEWEGEYEKALETYEQGLQIPGVNNSLISSLLVNIGIIYRLVGKERENKDQAIKDLREAIRFNGEGVDAKEVLGNADQLPIALHNLAETCLELGYRLEKREEKQDAYQLGFDHAQRGLDVNVQINSTKKLGQLLAERFVGWYNLRKLGIQPKGDEKEVRGKLAEWVKSKFGQSGYDITVVLDLLKLTDEFKGTSLEEAHSWLGEAALTDSSQPA